MPIEHQIVDPLTGETVTFTNPWAYDANRSAWIADDVDYVSKASEIRGMSSATRPKDGHALQL